MQLYNLQSVGWLESQLIYHALPRLGLEGLILLAPNSPYVCLGYHQDAAQEVDLDACRAAGIPVFRREVGGGAVFLDGNQVFYQIVLDRHNPLAAGSKEDFYRRLLGPVVATCHDLGLDAAFRPVNDIVVGARKISGNGAADIAGSAVLVGNLIVDFDYDTMVRVLRVPDEKFRDKVHKSLRDNLTTLRRELPEVPAVPCLYDTLARRFAEVLGPLTPAELPEAVHREVERLKPELTAEDWLMRRRPVASERAVKIASGREIVQRAYKAPGGLIRATVEVADGRVASADLSGDFFFYPAGLLDALAASLVGVRLEAVAEAIEAFYVKTSVESPGLTPQDLTRAIVG